MHTMTMNCSTKDACNSSTTMAPDDNLTTTEFVEDDAILSLRSQLNTVQYFVCPALLCIGLIGNICTVLTVSHIKFRNLTSRQILCALAFSDSLLLCTNPFNQEFMINLFDRDVRAYTLVGCKIFFFMYRLGKISSSWCIVLVAVERFLVVMFPLKAKLILQKKYIYIPILCVYVGVMATAGVWSFSTNVVDGKCLPDAPPSDKKTLHKCFVILGAVSYSLAPISILLTLTPPIVYKLLRSHCARQKMQRSAILRSARETSKISIMLIGVLISYIIWVTPITFVLIGTFWNDRPIFGSSEPKIIILQTVALIFEQINHSCNFFIYVTFSSQFRSRFKQMVCCVHLQRRDTVAVSESKIPLERKNTMQMYRVSLDSLIDKPVGDKHNSV